MRDAEPHGPIVGADEPEGLEGPVDHAVDGVQDPQPPDRAERDGATQGSKIRRRISHLPRKSLSRARASTLARTITSTWETTANTKVFFREVWNFVVETTLTKFLSPTKPSVRLPIVMSLTL